jgi:hypothetical protein
LSFPWGTPDIRLVSGPDSLLLITIISSDGAGFVDWA